MVIGMAVMVIAVIDGKGTCVSLFWSEYDIYIYGYMIMMFATQYQAIILKGVDTDTREVFEQKMPFG